jgi:hypothetical protein
MDIVHDDLLKNKYFLAGAAVVAIMAGVVWMVTNNSVEARCRRYAEGISGGRGGLIGAMVESASETVIESCIKRGGP